MHAIGSFQHTRNAYQQAALRYPWQEENGIMSDWRLVGSMCHLSVPETAGRPGPGTHACGHMLTELPSYTSTDHLTRMFHCCSTDVAHVWHA
eukprot:364569-Chlamydomonas_euryale.AAC.17